MASSDTSATLASSNFLGIINVLMQLRKVCTCTCQGAATVGRHLRLDYHDYHDYHDYRLCNCVAQMLSLVAWQKLITPISSFSPPGISPLEVGLLERSRFLLMLCYSHA